MAPCALVSVARQELTCVFVLFQCMICLRVPQASLESLFAAGLKTPHSCRSVLWTAVLASSPLCILKAKSSPGLHYHRIQNLLSLATFGVHTLTDCMERWQPNQWNLQSHRRVVGRQDCTVRAGLCRNVCICSLFSLCLLVTSRTVFSKGI